MVISNLYMTCGDFSENIAVVQGFDKNIITSTVLARKYLIALVKNAPAL